MLRRMDRRFDPTSARPPADATRRAYEADWAQFTRWCHLRGARPLPPAPELIAEYIAALARPSGETPALSRASIERRLSGLGWQYRRRGMELNRRTGPIAEALNRLRQAPLRPRRKDPVSGAEIRAMANTLPRDLRGLRDRAILLLGHAAGLNRAELVGLDLWPDTTPAAPGRLSLHAGGARIVVARRTGPLPVHVARNARPGQCAVHALEHWLKHAGITEGPIFTRVSRDGQRAQPQRLNDRHVARLVKQTVLAAGLRADLPEAERLALFSARSLRPRSDSAA